MDATSTKVAGWEKTRYCNMRVKQVSNRVVSLVSGQVHGNTTASLLSRDCFDYSMVNFYIPGACRNVQDRQLSRRSHTRRNRRGYVAREINYMGTSTANAVKSSTFRQG